MITVIICVVIGIILGVVSASPIKYNKGECFGYGLLGGVVMFVIGILIALVIPSDTIMVLQKTQDLEVLQDNNSISGSFLLGSGIIEGRMKYMYYYKTEGGYRMNQVSYEDALVKYSNRNKVEYYQEEEKENSFVNGFSLCKCRKMEVIFYVPKGTIKQNYNLDAQ